MNVFLTGATGFLGCEIATYLQHNDAIKRIYCLTKTPEKYYQLYDHLGVSSKLYYFEGDLRTITAIPPVIDTVIHCAAARNINNCENDPELTSQTNVTGTKQLLQAASKANVSRFIYMSSQSVYGTECKAPFHEEQTCHPDNAYAISKFCGEQLVTKHAATDSTIKCIIIRLARLCGFNPYYNKDQFILETYPRRCIQGKPLLVNGGRQCFDLISITDVAVAIEQLLFAADDVWNNTYNIGSGIPVSIATIATTFQAIAAELGLPTVKIIYNKVSCDPLTIWLDINKITTHLSWKPQKTLSTMVREILEFYSEEYCCN